MYAQICSTMQTKVHSVTKHLGRTVALATLSIVSIVFVAASLIPIAAFTGTALADTDCSPNGVAYSGSSWLGGAGVNICNHPGDGSHYCLTISGDPTGTNCPAGQVWSGDKWQCVEMINRLYLTQRWTTATWYGNGGGSTAIYKTGNLPANLTYQSNGTISYVNAGDVISLDHTGDDFGHAGVINSIDPNGKVYIKNQNADLDSSATIASGSLSGSNATYNMVSWAGYTVNGFIHHPSSNPNPNPLRIGEITTGGSYKAKEGSLGSGWVTMSNDSATQIMQDGTLSGMIWQGGFYVRQGALTNNWVTEANPGTALSGSISDTDGTTPIRIGLVLNDHTFWVREGLSGNWVEQATNTAVGYVSGNRIAALKTNGDFWVKEGANDTSGWVLENGSVSQGAISGGTGGLIGVLIGGTFLAKQGTLSSGWVTEQGAVSSIQLSNGNSTTGPRIGYIDTSNNFYAKQGLSGGWVLEGNNVNQAALSGQLIGKLQSGTYTVLQGALTASNWITEDGLITQIALWSPN